MRFRFFLLPFAIAAGCGGVISGTNDGGSDANGSGDVSNGGACTSSAQCANGGDCAYPVNGGCTAQKQCFPPKTACKALQVCTCIGNTISDDCNGGAQQPVAHTGVCLEGQCPQLACEVCDITGFSVSPQSTPNQATKACSQQDIASFVTACLSASATQTTCSAWQKSDAGISGCFDCLVTQDISAKWGPLVCNSSTCTINTSGCIDIVSGQLAIENGTNGSCGDLTNAANECIGYACGACTDPNDSATCANDVEHGACKSYFDAAQTASVCSLVDAGPSTCNPQGDSDWPAFINVFCGTGP